jgi:hypothetical protein
MLYMLVLGYYKKLSLKYDFASDPSKQNCQIRKETFFFLHIIGVF